MKKILFATLVLFASVSVFAQLSTKQLPRSFKMDINYSSIPTIKMQSPDVDALLAQDEENSKNLFKPQRCATIIPLESNFFDDAMHLSLSDADIYLLKVNIPYAQALNLYSSNFYIPKGGELYLWNPSHSKVLGAFTSDNNSESGYFATDYVYDDEIVFEYYQPKSIRETASIELNEIGYFYRDVINYEEIKISEDEKMYKGGFRTSGNCHINANCSEGEDYRDVQRAVCRILIRMSYYDTGWCTGTLINNTNEDKTPYVLSAGHCIEEVASNNYYGQFVFYFNYESSGCSTPTQEPSYTSLTGCTRLAFDNTYANNGSDYWLMRLQNSVPQSMNPYWAGWSRSTSTSRNGVCFHHPNGDIKKIASYRTALTTSKYNDNADHAQHWIVRWAQTDNGLGVTEGGSSGSGLFNEDGKLIGTLSGGYAYCGQAASNQIDYYGKFNQHFSNISQWLDPAGTDQTELGGRDYNNASSIDEVSENALSLSIYPNPAKDFITINIDGSKEKTVVAVMDYVGRTVLSDEISEGITEKTLNISSLEPGTYFVRIYSNKNSVVKKITKE
ncbi:MAG: T9SS type A sorting domain-containing protein [Bacteroidales bacterium]|nr:T9SS type A sorting domain-containing protein [Bacteroidales bacterium]